MSVSPFVPKEQLGFHWTDCHEISYLNTLRKTAEEVSLKSDKNNGYFTCRSIHIFILSRSFLLRVTSVSDNSCRGNQNTHFIISNFFLRIVPFIRYCGKIL